MWKVATKIGKERAAGRGKALGASVVSIRTTSYLILSERPQHRHPFALSSVFHSDGNRAVPSCTAVVGRTLRSCRKFALVVRKSGIIAARWLASSLSCY